MDLNSVRSFVGQMLYLGYDYIEATGLDESDLTSDALDALNEFRELCDNKGMSPYKAFIKAFYKC